MGTPLNFTPNTPSNERAPRILYTGTADFSIVAINPTDEEKENLKGFGLASKQTVDEERDTVNCDIYVESKDKLDGKEINLKGVLRFSIKRTPFISTKDPKNPKMLFIDPNGETLWLHYTEKKQGKNVIYMPVRPTEEFINNSGYGDYMKQKLRSFNYDECREGYRGEEALTRFVSCWLGVSYRNSLTRRMNATIIKNNRAKAAAGLPLEDLKTEEGLILNIEPMLEGDFSELQKTLVRMKEAGVDNKIKVGLGVKNELYQDFFLKAFGDPGNPPKAGELKNAYGINKELKNDLEYAKLRVQNGDATSVSELLPDYGPSDLILRVYTPGETSNNAEIDDVLDFSGGDELDLSDLGL